jgi:2-polyprenyl-3-methyl-5-hydroxy-6-metoxy-1,4-benzoquinol methylase
MKIAKGEIFMNLYNEKNNDYFSRARTEIESLLQPKKGLPLRALEIGCSQGHTLEWLKKTGYCSWVAGVEPYSDLQTSAGAIDRFYKLDIEKEMPDIPTSSIDLILCLDVLEHLNNPWETLRRLGQLLKPGGQLIVSVPNVRNYRILFDLAFRGRFNYTESGILDRTHLRFFTRSSLLDLVESTDIKVTTVRYAEPLRRQKRVLGALGLGDFLAKQFLVSATKISTAESHARPTFAPNK